MTAYYNEIDPYAAQWLRNLIAEGHIADGVVDERSISDVRPDELYEFTQCHFFAGIGIWSYALRQAGWSDDRPVWTGSCPCQPFSGAGTRKGMADERHLWPHWFHLLQECRPATVFGEQVASKDGLGWIDLVQADMEGADYAIGAFDMCSAGFGAPHIRQRLWFVADTDNPRSQGWISRGSNSERQDQHRHVGCGSTTDGMGDTDNIGSQGSSQTRVSEEMENTSHEPARAVADVGVDNSDETTPDETNGFWGDADWLLCRDGKWRPVEPCTFPLVNGATARVGRLRAYGNAITAQVAQGLIETYVEVR